jgi:hypothetical protein
MVQVDSSLDVYFAFYLLGLPAVASRLFAPPCISFSNTNTPKGFSARSRWQATWRSFIHACLLVLLLLRGFTAVACARVVFWYVVIDFTTAAWEVGGNLHWDNWAHHGATMILTGLPLVSPLYGELAENIGKPFLWLEWTTILLNLYYFAKTYRAPALLVGMLSYTFSASFFATRCLYFGHFVYHLVANGRSAFWILPLHARVTVLSLALLQWVWFGLMVQKLFTSIGVNRTTLSKGQRHKSL